MLNDPHLKIVYYEQDSSKVFPNTDIKGGIAVSYMNRDLELGPIGAFFTISNSKCDHEKDSTQY